MFFQKSFKTFSYQIASRPRSMIFYKSKSFLVNAPYWTQKSVLVRGLKRSQNYSTGSFSTTLRHFECLTASRCRSSCRRHLVLWNLTSRKSIFEFTEVLRFLIYTKNIRYSKCLFAVESHGKTPQYFYDQTFFQNPVIFILIIGIPKMGTNCWHKNVDTTDIDVDGLSLVKMRLWANTENLHFSDLEINNCNYFLQK